jgi:archaellum component FlaC
MQKSTYWIIGLLMVSLIFNFYTFFSKKDVTVDSLQRQNDSLRVQLGNVKKTIDGIDLNLKNQLSKVDSSINNSRQTIASMESSIHSVRVSISNIKQTDPDSYYKSLSREEKEKLRNLIYQDVVWK